MKKDKLIPVLYRITKEQKDKIRIRAKKSKISESGFLRKVIDLTLV